MAPKIVFLIIAAFSTLQVSANEELSIFTPLDLVIDLMEQSLEYIHKIINLLFDGTEDTLKRLLAKVDSLRVGALDLAEKQIQIETVLLNRLIEVVKNRTSGASIDLLNCIEKIEVDAENVERQAINTSVACIDVSIEATGSNIISILEDFRQINNDFDHNREKLAVCKGQLLPFNCIKNVVVDLGKLALAIPSRLKIEADKAMLDFVALGYEVLQCTQQGINIINDKRVTIIETFSQCVNGIEHRDETTQFSQTQ